MIFDNHAHLQTSGKNIEAVKIFEKEGGTHLNVCNVPLQGYEYDDLYYEKIYNETLKIVSTINSETGVKAYATIGPYPVDLLDALNRGMSMDRALTIMKKGVDIAAKLVEDQKAIAIGEVGRPHFPVSESLWQQFNDLILYIFEKARDIDCAVVMHTEYTPETMKEIANMADQARLKKSRIVKHYSPPLINDNENYGIFPSVIATRKNVREAFQKGTRFFLETDYVDDLKTPNFVLAIDTVPKRIRSVINEGLIDMEKLTDTTIKNIYEVYRVRI
jgi:TatD-related deoxyribonuclease